MVVNMIQESYIHLYVIDHLVNSKIFLLKKLFLKKHLIQNDQNSKPLEKEDKIKITLVNNSSVKYKKRRNIQLKPRDRIFVKGYGFQSFARNRGKNIGNNVSKNLSGESSQKLLDHAKQSATDALKTTPKKAIHKIVEATGDFDW